jgi:hypothetical protein
MRFNPALNLQAFSAQSVASAPPSINAIYLRDGKYDNNMKRADVTATFEAFRTQTATNRLAFFFHGGLVDKASGQQGAANQYDNYKDVVFPLFFIWESGFWEVLAHHYPLIFAETIFGRIVDHVLDLVSSKTQPAQGGATTNRLALTAPSFNDMLPQLRTITLTNGDIDGFMNAIKNDVAIQQEAVAIARTSQPTDTLLASGASAKVLQLSPRTYLAPEVVSAIRGAYVQANRSNIGSGLETKDLPFDIGGALQAAWAVAKSAVPVIINFFKRFADGRDHGVPCTIVEEVLRALYLANTGSSIWEEMKRETEDAFGADSSVYGGTAVIEELCSQLKQKPNTLVTLVGHSTGAIYIGNFLRHVDMALRAQGDVTTTFDIILLAPASTTDFYASTYVSRIRGIRIFQMQDAVEQQDHLLSQDAGPADPSILGKFYPRSLLYLVSGICEYFEGQDGSGPHALDGDDMPILGMDRFFAQTGVFSAADYPSVGNVRTQFAVAPPTTATKYVRVLSPTATTPNDGYRSTARKHGDFPGDQLTIDSVRLCFQQGL